MDDRPELSLVVPVYDEEETLPLFRDEPLEVMRGLGRSFEMLFVDDGSRDRSGEILGEMAREIPEVRVLTLDRNHGLTSALHAGFGAALGSVIVSMDADLQNDPKDIPRLLELIPEYDLVCGWRKERDDPFIKRLSSKLGNGFRNWRLGESIHDSCCPLKALRAEVVPHFLPYNGLHRFIPTLTRLAGFNVTEIPVNHRRRERGTSKYGVWNRLWKGLSDMKAIRWMRRNRLTYVVASDDRG